jgi:hypothetical protein
MSYKCLRKILELKGVKTNVHIRTLRNEELHAVCRFPSHWTCLVIGFFFSVAQ